METQKIYKSCSLLDKDTKLKANHNYYVLINYHE